MDDRESISTLAEALVSELIVAGKSVATAESCTGGWIAKALTDVGGSSQCFGYGVVSYADGAKEALLGVRQATLRDAGAVSEATVTEMATGVLSLSGADYAVAVSGIAGPDGGTGEKPVGTVWFAWAERVGSDIGSNADLHVLKGGRESIRSQSVIIALQGIRERLRRRG